MLPNTHGFATNRVIAAARIGNLHGFNRHSIKHVLYAIDNEKNELHYPTQNKHIRGAKSAIQHFINKVSSQVSQYFIKISLKKCAALMLSLALLFSLPMQSGASSMETSPSSSYYLQNNPQQYSVSQRRQKEVISVQAQPFDSDYKLIKQRSTSHMKERKKQSVKQISMFVILSTLAASSFRASLRKKRVVRTVSPFGRIRNASPLGNGVSIMRVCMALEFDSNDTEENEIANALLHRLHLEEKELYNKKELLSQLNGGELLGGLKQKATADYLSAVASIFAKHYPYLTLATLDWMKIPFREEAVKIFKSGVEEEHTTFGKQQTNASEKSTRYILATILLAIKGDRTRIPLPMFGVVRKRDIAAQLPRIAKDAKVEDCLVASELITIPNVKTVSSSWDSSLTREDIMNTFPELVPLT